MRSSSRRVVAIAISLGAAACFNRDIAAPPEAPSGQISAFQRDPITLDARFVAGHDYVVLTWQLNDDIIDRAAVDFLVERSDDIHGEWLELVRTRNLAIGDNVVAEPRCYRVTALVGLQASGQSEPLCVADGKIFR